MTLVPAEPLNVQRKDDAIGRLPRRSSPASSLIRIRRRRDVAASAVPPGPRIARRNSHGAPNANLAKVHDRQVVTLGPDQFSAWLEGSAGTETLVPAPEEAIRYWPVSKRINKVSAPHDDKTLIEPVILEAESGTALLV